MIKRLVLTPGDPGGIGPEVTRKAFLYLNKDSKFRKISFVVVGAESACDEIAELKLRNVDFILAPARAPRGLHLAGFQSGWSVARAVDLLLKKAAQGLVTGPISKENLISGGFSYAGHTDMLADLTRTPGVTMCLENRFIRSALVTTHLPLSKVAAAITKEKIARAVNQTVHYLRAHHGIRKPHIVVTGLNPHAGENGKIGTEEKKIIGPAVKKLQIALRGRATLIGPVPADTAFIHFQSAGAPDAYVCMFHDQGLIPVKTLDFANSVNVTLGLPFLRTSVDHGTAFDIAGKDKADPSSMIAAIRKFF